MEHSELQAALAAAAEEVLETMYFATVLNSAEGTAAGQAGGGHGSGEAKDGEGALRGELEFQGSLAGRFRVSAPTGLARVIAGGFLGLEEAELSDEQAGEVICEMANMICGSALNRLDRETAFRLSHPILVSGTADGSGQGASRWFDIGDGVLTATLEIQTIT